MGRNDVAGSLPELAAIPWRPLTDERSLRRMAFWWTVTTLGCVVPFCAVAVLLFLLDPRTAPIGLFALAHAWAIAELWANRGVTPLKPRRSTAPETSDPETSDPETSERTALGLLGDLVGSEARDGFVRTGLVREPGKLGVWLVGEAGALLVRPKGRRVNCYCVRVPDPDLPRADRVAHLLLALRMDERGFATLANLAFSGARWRVRRRLPAPMRPALDAAGRLARHG